MTKNKILGGKVTQLKFEDRNDPFNIVEGEILIFLPIYLCLKKL